MMDFANGPLISGYGLVRTEKHQGDAEAYPAAIIQ
jgi:hypothetical protein